MTPEEEYNHFTTLHRDFSKTYSQVYKHVMDFYPRPQKFIQEAMPEIDNYIEKLSGNDHNPESRSTFRTVLYFAKNFKDFADNTNNVFEEYKSLYGESDHYIKDVFKLKERGHDATARPDEFAKLIPVLNKLITGFKRIEQKTDETAKTLQQLQQEWSKLKTSVHNERNGTSWPL